jgi:uncharacterized protein YjbI with pentapeptide repeats
MANEEHLARLKERNEWNKWRDETFLEVKPDLQYADLSGAELTGANLLFADLFRADLSHADLHRGYLVDANLSDADLRDADLRDADLRDADLRDADLRDADLRDADLSRASLETVQALGTDFTGAILTGACIEDWHINSTTKLDKVVCEYVYLKNNAQERRPSDPNRIFAPGEFTKLFQKVLETVDLIFADGIDWKAFFQSFQELQ